MNSYLVVFLGGGLGAMCRHAVNVLAAHVVGTRYPAGTFAINVFGSFLIGVVAGYFAFRSQGADTAPLFLVTGIIGGFTTFSAFSLETGLLIQRGEVAAAVVYVTASVTLSIAAMFGGLFLLRH